MHEHTNKDVLDQTTAPFTIPEKEKLAGLENYDDTEIRELIHETGHTHTNKSLLDTITPSSLWNEADRIKFNDLHNYDDTEVIVRIETLEEKSHTHSNKNILDQTTAPFKTADKEKLDSLQNYDVFRGTDGIYPGGKGLVPGPTIEDSGKFLSSSGEWLYVTAVTNDFVGATATEDGEHGLVPAPTAGEQSYYLRGDGIWAKVKTGDKYKAGDGIYILAGDASSTTLPVEIYAKANKLKQYVLYGGENPVGDWDSTLNKYAVVIKVSAEGMSDISTSLFLDDPIGNGDYIDYENQRFVHTRTNMTVSVRSGEWSEWINVDGAISNWHQDSMAPSDYIAVSSEYVYLYYPGDMHGCDRFDIPCYAALYDENKVFTRSILLRSFTEVTIEPQPGEAYMRVSYGYYQGATYRLTKIGEVITPIILPPVIIYTNKVNTIDVMTANKPTEVYFETVVAEDTSEDPMSEYTGIIYNEGVLDITQEDPTALNELTVHFRESDKVITIPGNTYTAGDGIDIDANDEISTKLGSGLSFDNNAAITVDEMTGATALANGASGTVPAPLAGDDAKFLRGDGSWAEIEIPTKYVEGDAIEFSHPGMTDLGFDFDTFVSKFTPPNNGIVSVDSANKAFTLTATGFDCYTNPWVSGPLYTIPVIGGRKYRLTWNSNASNVDGTIYAFENANTSHMHGVNQAEQNYLEFTADTSSNVNFRFGVTNSGNSITYSNIKFYEVDNADPDTNIINVKYGNGLSLDNNNTLQVDEMVGATSQTAGQGGTVPAPSAGDETKFLRGDGTWVVVESGVEYVAGDGISITDAGSINPDYYFDTQVSCNLSGNRLTMTYTKYNTDPAFGAIVSVYTNESFTGPVFVGRTPDSVKYTSNTGNPQGTVVYRDETWYYSTFDGWVDGERVDTLNNMQKIEGLFNTPAQTEDIVFAILDAAYGSPTVTEKEISVVPATTETIGGVIVGDGLEIDEEGVLSAPGGKTYVAGDGITITDSTSFELSEDTVTNTEYFFDTQVTSNVSGRTFTKYNTEPALGAVVYASSYTQPYFVGLTADSVKYGTDYDSHIWPNPDHPSFEYKGVTWYYSGNAYGMPGDRTDSLGHMQKLPGSYPASTEADLQNIAKAIIDAADIITDPTKIISAKIGEGLSFDANDAIQNEGLLSVTQDFDDRNHLTFGTAYGDIDIMIPGGEPAQYVRVSTNDSFLLLRTKPADWDDAWYRYYMLSYDELTVEPPDWDPTRHYKYENDNYVLGSPGDTFISTTWYDKHYNGLDPNTPVIFDSDVYYTGDLRLIEDGETYDTAFTKINEAIEHVERLEQNVQFLHDNKVDVRKTVDPERIEFYYS